MHSPTREMVEKKVLEMAQHASFHQHVSYNLSTILHAFTAGKTDPAEIAEAFSRAGGLEVITRVISGERLAKPAVVSLCCGVARRVIDEFGLGVAESQARRLAEAVVSRLGRGISGDDAQTVECQVECARLLSSIAGRSSSLLLSGGALGTLEDMLERLGAEQRPGSSGRSLRKRPPGHSRMPSFRSLSPGAGHSPSWGWGEKRSILRPCCEAMERVSQSQEGRDAFEERGTGGILLATIRDFPDALEEGSDPALTSALKVVERIFTNKSPEACALALRAHTEEESSDDPHQPTASDYACCTETLLAVAEVTSEAPGAAAANCLWWLSGASDVAPDRALGAILAEAAVMDGGEYAEEGERQESIGREEDMDSIAKLQSEVWSWFPLASAQVVVAGAPNPRPLEAARFIAALCLSKLGLKTVERGVRRDCARTVDALVKLCGSEDPSLASACLRIVERLARADIGQQVFLEAGALRQAVEAGVRCQSANDASMITIDDDTMSAEDAHALAIAAALGTVASLAGACGEDAWPLVDEAFQVSVRCLGRIAEYPGRPAAAAAKSALDVITIRLSRSDRPKGSGVCRVASFSSSVGGEGGGDEDGTAPSQNDDADDRLISGAVNRSAVVSELDEPMEILGDASAILAAMKAHPTNVRVQQSGWKSLIAMDTGRGDVEALLGPCGDGKRSTRQILKDALKRHAGDSLVAGQVADILEGLVLQGESDGENSLTTSVSDVHGEESPPWPNGEVDSSNIPDENPCSDVSEIASPTEGIEKAATEDEPSQEFPVGEESVVPECDGGLEVSGSDVSADAMADDRMDGEGVVRDGAFDDGAESGCGGDERSPEDMLLALSVEGQKALRSEGQDSDDSSSSVDGNSTDGNGSIVGTSIVRALFCEEIPAQNDQEAGEPNDPPPAVISRAQLRLDGSWGELDRLYKDVIGRSELLGGESAEMVAAMYDPDALREKIRAALEGASGEEARNAVATSSLAMVDALTAATGALAASQKEVQRYLQLSRDLRETSTLRDKLDAMQWTMDTLKSTVILFTPHTGHLITKDLGLCKNMESASKLFKEAALNIKIVVVELAGEHEPNTEWRIAPGAFESLPENRKVMMLRHLRSLVVAYDHLSEDKRKELTTALEIIKNREALNKMGKSCVEAEALEERRRQAKIRAAKKNMQGQRRSYSTPGSSNSKRSSSVGSRSPVTSRGTPDFAARTFRDVRPSPVCSTPPGTPGSSNGSRTASTPNGSRRGSRFSIRSSRSSDSGSDITTPGPGPTSVPRPRGIAYQQRKRDDTGSTPSARSRSTVPQSRAKSPTSRDRPSKNPVVRGRHSTSPTPRRRVSKSLTARPTNDANPPATRISRLRKSEG